MNDYFSEKDVVRSHNWFNHGRFGFTELGAFHPEYLPGQAHFQKNLDNYWLPQTWYVRNAEQLMKFILRFAKTHTCCEGLNPRLKVLCSETGRRKRTGDAGIELVTNIVFDFDPRGEPTDEQVGESGMFLETTETFFRDLGVLPPLKAFSGRGYHLLFAVPPIRVKECPDIRERLNTFRQRFQKAFAKELSGLGLKLDSTQDLSRLVKIYGTKKPGGRRLSRFPECERKEDGGLRDYLLGLSIEEKTDIPVVLPEKLPAAFEQLLAANEKVRQLWEGVGKTEGDTTCSGYDFSLVKSCLNGGITDLKDLTAILALRPKGGVRASRKSGHYIRLTIANAIKQ